MAYNKRYLWEDLSGLFLLFVGHWTTTRKYPLTGSDWAI